MGEEDEGGLWPENELVVGLFVLMHGQWRCGPGGPIGFDYGVLPRMEHEAGVPKAKRSETFQALRVMEDEALKYFAEERRRD